MPSPFLQPGPSALRDELAILYLKREQVIPTILSADSTDDAVEHTRFGSFPHDTLIGQPWGSQVRAFKVDTGSRSAKTKKRKRERDTDPSIEARKQIKEDVVAAGTGFAHLLQPTPESWTSGLTHRTQVVYASDYTYILQRLRATPGTRLIEAGAGSGSFTHAAARAVFDGDAGHVYSFEYHDVRARELSRELHNHGLSDLVTVTHQDVYVDGFDVKSDTGGYKTTLKANAVFLDLPAPWMALRHLTRLRLPRTRLDDIARLQDGAGANKGNQTEQTVKSEDVTVPWISPLDPSKPTLLCTFTPCIEQVQSVVAALRQLDWTEIDMVEVQDHRMDIRRERVGLAEEGLRGTDSGPKDVNEALSRLREVEGRFQTWTSTVKATNGQKSSLIAKEGVGDKDLSLNATQQGVKEQQERKSQKQRRQEENRAQEKKRKLFLEGSIVTRIEQEVKNHTAYLVFAVLPVNGTENEEYL